MGECEFEGQHPAIEARLAGLEAWVAKLEEKLEGVNKIRASDIKDFKKDLSDVTKKVDDLKDSLNAIALQLATINGKAWMFAFVMPGFGAIFMFALTKLFDGGK